MFSNYKWILKGICRGRFGWRGGWQLIQLFSESPPTPLVSACCEWKTKAAGTQKPARSVSRTSLRTAQVQILPFQVWNKPQGSDRRMTGSLQGPSCLLTQTCVIHIRCQPSHLQAVGGLLCTLSGLSTSCPFWLECTHRWRGPLGSGLSSHMRRTILSFGEIETEKDVSCLNLSGLSALKWVIHCKF